MFKLKVVTNEDNYKEVVIKRAIILCWFLLFVCFIIKIFGGNFFNIICNNEKFVVMCEIINKNIIKYLIYYITFLYTLSNLLIICNPNIEIISIKFLLFIFIITIYWFLKLVIDLVFININILIYNIINFCILYIILLVFSKRKYNSLFVVIYDLLITLLSVFVKNLGVIVITDNFMIDIIYVLDYYIILTITSLYSKLKRRE